MSRPQDQPPGKRTTAADVAARAGVSRATVGYVLNQTPGQTISAETSRRVRDAATALDYRPHRSAQTLARGSSDIVLVVVPPWPSGHTTGDSVEAAALRLAEHGLALITQVRQSSDVRPIWQSIEPLVFAAFTPLDEGTVRAMRAAGITHVLSIPTGLPGAMDGVRLQFEHLHDLGHRVIGYAASGDARVRSVSDGRAQLFAQLAQTRIAPPVVETIGIDDGSACTALDRWIATGVTAVAAFDDEIAAAIVRAMHMRGLSAPGDLSVIGHDGAPIATLLTPTLTTVAVDAAQHGRRLADMVLEAVTGETQEAPTDPLFSLIVRESTRPARPAEHP